MTQATPPPRPTAMPINLDGIPPCLKERPQWVLWRYELDAERQDWAKIPRQLNGRKAKANDPNGSALQGRRVNRNCRWRIRPCLDVAIDETVDNILCVVGIREVLENAASNCEVSALAIALDAWGLSFRLITSFRTFVTVLRIDFDVEAF